MAGAIDIYVYSLFLSGIFSCILALYSWNRFAIQQKMNPAKYLSFLLICIGIWSFGSGFALWFTSESLTYFCEQWKYLGITYIPVSWFLFASSWTGRDKQVNNNLKLLLYILPLFFLGIIFTDSMHALFWQEIEYVSVGSYLDTSVIHGPMWWLMWGYAYIFLILGTTYLVKGAISLHTLYRKQAVLLLLGAVIPWVANFIYSFRLTSTLIGSLDLTSISFAFTGLIYTYGFTRFKILDLFPVSKESVFNNLHDPVLVFDTNKRLIELNKSAEHSFHLHDKKVIGKSVYDVFLSYPEIINLFEKQEIQQSFEMSVDVSGSTTYFDVTFSQVTEKNRETGYVLSFRDITRMKNITDALRESENKFRTFTESASIAIMIYQDDKWIYANPAAEKISGYTKDELLQMNFWEFVHPDYKDMIIQRGKARQQGKNPPSNYEFKIITKQGVEKWVDFSANKISYEGNIAVLIAASDITKQKRSAQTINKQLTAIKSSMDGIAILDHTGTYVFANNAFAHIYGYDSPEELIGRSWRVLYDEKEMDRYDTSIKPVFLKNGWWRGEAVGKKKDGAKFSQEVTLTALDDGGLVCIARDTTKQKMVLKELQDAHEVLFTINKDLERKVQQRTQEVEELVKQKDGFINQLGHDLKTPLTPIMVLLPMLEKNVDSEKDKELFNVVERNVLFMKELVNKTINLAKLNSDKVIFNIETISLTDEIRNAVETNQVLFEENNIDVENHVKEDIYIQADQIQLQELLNNLITNAVKYSHEHGGSIFIDANEEKDSQYVTVSIQDTGIGMDPDQIKKAFKEFYKADDSRHNLDSSGLGLNICKRIVEKHGGSIWVESPGKNQGSTFYFTIKKAKSDQRRKEELTVPSQ